MAPLTLRNNSLVGNQLAVIHVQNHGKEFLALDQQLCRC
ncbi:hypothetical protein EJ110_NYTH23004 [Nymphaea thermarum]|nr:hypothetical protein EJ110_NYTH23004 [Nymphaea thermarum]